MMRSLFSGVSGLRNHQVRMDVIGNNIANINTIGFKSGRVTFQESLTQLLRNSSRPRGGVGGLNPMQVGLGISIGSIDTDFAQGNLETTNNPTDLAIQGDAFFVLSDGVTDYYARAGNFVVDGEGRLVAPKNGFVVQGLMADSAGNIASGQTISDITLPFGQKAPARATGEIDYTCNLDSDTEGRAQMWAADFSKVAEITASAAPTALTIDATNDTLTIEVDDDMGNTTTRTLTLTSGIYATVSHLVAEINTQIGRYDDIAGEVVADVVDSGGADVIQVRTTDFGGTLTELTLSGNACANMNLSTTKTTGTDVTTDIADLPIVVNTLTDGDIIRISGLNPDGTVTNASYTYTTGDTIQNIIDELNAAFSGATAFLDTDGNIILTDSIRGETDSAVTLTFSDDDSSGSAINLPVFVAKQTGREAGTHTASITAYDSKGDTHAVSLLFTNISTAELSNVWSWEAVVDNGEVVPSAGNKGILRFNSDGSLAVCTTGDGQPLTFDPGGGADTLRINLGTGEAGTFGGITQLRAPTTTVAKHQDGYGMGNLQTVSIDDTGDITGHFSNGVTQTLAQIVLAKFNNPAGLMRAGDNMYQASANAGTPVKGTVGSGSQATVLAGALEMSNVDLAREFTDMIVAQRGFQANARVITTADTLLDEIVRLKR